MKRRDFLKGMALAGLPLGWLAGRAARARQAGLVMNRFYIAGFQYYQGPGLLESIRPGQRLEMAAEPDNLHDRFAVRLCHRGRMLGYVPRTDNRHLSRLLRQGAKLQCRVLQVESSAPTWWAVRVEVSLAQPQAPPPASPFGRRRPGPGRG